ncbi:MAG TPA: choice-of-anchor V domain-containing protein [Bryobacteraceae bacterium]|nr:choice-of-anchor V domain-containing protein [Bryobacteraceae bacterium]
MAPNLVPQGGATFQFDWTPPATNAGPVTFFVAGNAANGDRNFTGDLIYTSSLQLTPAVPAAPSVTAGNIVNAATTLAGPVAPNSWVTIYGSNLGVTTRSWADSDFLDGALPSSLDGVSVVLTLFGAPRLTYVGYVSPTQVNFLLPSDLSVTATTVQVRNPAGMSTAVPITTQANAPQLFITDGRHVLCAHSNGAFLTSTTPAAPGETIVVYGTGLGATNPAQVPGQVAAAPASLVTLPQVTIGGAAATVACAGIVPGSAGLYQINVRVPSDAVNGDLPLIFQLGTASSASTLVTVQK